MKTTRTISLRVYITLWGIAALAPFLLFCCSPLAAAILGVIVAAFWTMLMPHSCMNGAFICFPLSLAQLGLGAMWGIRIYTEIRNLNGA